MPVPPRGWWARKEAGKEVEITALPPLPFVMANYFPALDQTRTGAEQGQAQKDTLPDPPIFRDLAQVQDEIRAAVRPIKVPSVLTEPHALVARLLKQDAERKPASTSGHYLLASDVPRFASPLQQRRLRVLSCIFTELTRLGCKATGSTHAGERFSVKVGEAWTYISLRSEGGAAISRFHSDRQSNKQPDRERLRFDIVDHDDRTPPKGTWREDKAPLDQQVADIVRGLLLQVEDDSRRWALLHHKWICDAHERRLREARLAAEQAEADRIARTKAAAAARIQALVGGGEALERASQIRRYVAAVRSAHSESPEICSLADLDRWAVWALAEADGIDPIASRRFLADLDLPDERS